MWTGTIVALVLASHLASATLWLHGSCYAPRFMKGQVNLVEQGYRNVFNDVAAVMEELQKPEFGAKNADPATIRNRYFSQHFKMLFGTNSAAVLADGLVCGANFVQRHGPIRRYIANNGNPGPVNSIPVDDTIIFCDLSQIEYQQPKASLAPGQPVAPSLKFLTINGVRIDSQKVWSPSWYDDCKSNGEANLEGFTYGRTALALRYPMLPNYTILCPSWFDYMLSNRGSIDEFERKSYDKAFMEQRLRLPVYPWPQFTKTGKAGGDLRRYFSADCNYYDHISMDRGIWFQHTLFHELTHTGWWSSPKTPNLRDVPAGGAYGWDNAIMHKNPNNADTWAFVVDGWYAIIRRGLLIDTAGEFQNGALYKHFGTDVKYKDKPTRRRRTAPPAVNCSVGKPQLGAAPRKAAVSNILSQT